MLKILIAVDGSEQADRAIEAVGHMVRSSVELSATVLCVSPEPAFYSSYSAATIQKIEDEQIVQQNVILRKAVEHARAAGFTVEPARAYGVIADEIVRVAKDRQVDQIAMGTSGMGVVGSLFLGSVAQRVVHQSSVPVLLVR